MFFEKLSQNAIKPEKGTPGSAGYDVFAAEDVIIPAKSNALVPTDIALKMSEGIYGKICDRSSYALKKKLSVMGGVIG